MVGVGFWFAKKHEDFDDIKATKLFGNDFELISSFYPTPDYNFYKFIFKPDS